MEQLLTCGVVSHAAGSGRSGARREAQRNVQVTNDR